MVGKGTKLTSNLFLERYLKQRKIKQLEQFHNQISSTNYYLFCYYIGCHDNKGKFKLHPKFQYLDFVHLLHFLHYKKGKLKLHIVYFQNIILNGIKETKLHKFQYLDFIHPLHLCSLLRNENSSYIEFIFRTSF